MEKKEQPMEKMILSAVQMLSLEAKQQETRFSVVHPTGNPGIFEIKESAIVIGRFPVKISGQQLKTDLNGFCVLQCNNLGEVSFVPGNNLSGHAIAACEISEGILTRSYPFYSGSFYSGVSLEETYEDVSIRYEAGVGAFFEIDGNVGKIVYTGGGIEISLLGERKLLAYSESSNFIKMAGYKIKIDLEKLSRPNRDETFYGETIRYILSPTGFIMPYKEGQQSVRVEGGKSFVLPNRLTGKRKVSSIMFSGWQDISKISGEGESRATVFCGSSVVLSKGVSSLQNESLDHQPEQGDVIKVSLDVPETKTVISGDIFITFE